MIPVTTVITKKLKTFYVENIEFVPISVEVIGRVSVLAAVKNTNFAILGKQAVRVFGITVNGNGNGNTANPLVAFGLVKGKIATHVGELNQLELCWDGITKIQEAAESLK
ncbi:hypothetical protein HY798_03135 [Candidatus Falkowbacteria bacterium]|nr:hypothetical protein [Candidatus Falkowbacteria bacterium]